MSHFTDFGLAAPIVCAVQAKGYLAPTPIQSQAIPHILRGGDVLGIAATGTGKTAAFALPILHRLVGARLPERTKHCRALVLCPTRELAAQIAESFKTYGATTGLVTATLIGGVSFGKQAGQLRQGADIIVATPGRLLDHLQQGTLKLEHVKVLVLDEADHMLDLGFIPAVRRIVKALPKDRQTLFFSATMPDAIRALSGEMLRSPSTVSVTRPSAPAAGVVQRVKLVEVAAKRNSLAKLLREHAADRSLVFTRTKRGADRAVKDLLAQGIAAAAIHGNKSQNQRERVLGDFRAGRTRILVATDIAARGIDIGGIGLVVNFDLPEVPETYVHRIGRTARAGASGVAISLCSPDERPLLKAIERTTGQRIERIGPQSSEPTVVPFSGPGPKQGRARKQGPTNFRKGTHPATKAKQTRRSGRGRSKQNAKLTEVA